MHYYIVVLLMGIFVTAVPLPEGASLTQCKAVAVAVAKEAASNWKDVTFKDDGGKEVVARLEDLSVRCVGTNQKG